MNKSKEKIKNGKAKEEMDGGYQGIYEINENMVNYIGGGQGKNMNN